MNSPLSTAEVRAGSAPLRIRRGLQLSRSGAPQLFDTLLMVQVLEALAVAAMVQAVQRLTGGLVAGWSMSGNDWRAVLGPAAALAAALVTIGVCQAITPAITAVLGERLAGVSTANILRVAGSVDLIEFDRPDVLDRLKRVEVGAMIRPAQLAGGLGILLSGAVGVVALTVSVFLVEPWLALAAVAAAVPLWWAARRDGNSQYETIRGLSRLERRRMYLAGLLTRRERAAEIRALELLPRLLERYRAISDERCKEVRRTAWQRARRQLTVRLIGGALMMVGVLITLLLLRSGALTVPDAVAAATAGAALRGRLVEAATGIRAVQEAAEFVEDHDAVCAMAPVRVNQAEPPVGDCFHSLSLRGVGLVYPGSDEAALFGVDLDIPVGGVVALVGANGSGKSTLAAIAAGLLVPTSGRVARNGVDLRDLPDRRWRSEVSVLLQDAGRYQESVRDNVAFGAADRPIDDDWINDCLATAGIPAVKTAAPDPDDTCTDTTLTDRDRPFLQLDTRLGREQDGDLELSGGQWQRLALARTFYRDGRLLILDEPSAALDPMAERDLVDRLRCSFTDRAVLLVTHRMAAAGIADQVVVLDHGRIVEQGSPAELLRSAGVFAQMCRAQAELWQPQDDPATLATV